VTRQAEWRKRNPWARFVEWARRRCTDIRKPDYKYYGGRGIQCHLKAEQLKEIWYRDEAWKLERASLDRKNPDFDYANWNVRFIEFHANVIASRGVTLPWPEVAPEFT
jgi:hypothetical protein